MKDIIVILEKLHVKTIAIAIVLSVTVVWPIIHFNQIVPLKDRIQELKEDKAELQNTLSTYKVQCDEKDKIINSVSKKANIMAKIEKLEKEKKNIENSMEIYVGGISTSSESEKTERLYESPINVEKKRKIKELQYRILDLQKML